MAFRSSFGRVADLYIAFRPAYPDELFERILAVVPPEFRHRAMDLGAGTGNSLRPLVPHFEELIAVEPDRLMADELRTKHPQIILHVATAEECGQGSGSVDLVTSGSALHWMDVPRVIANILRWLRPAGVLAIWAGGIPAAPEPVNAVTLQELNEHWSRFRDPRNHLAQSSDHVRRAMAGFTILEERVIPNIVWLRPHELVGFWRSTSHASAYARELAVPEAYWRDLETRYSLAWPRAKIPVDLSPWLLLARKD
jgi:trans-aconitate methyltransferase